MSAPCSSRHAQCVIGALFEGRDSFIGASSAAGLPHHFLCFDSLTALLQRTPFERACRFLHVLQSQIRTVGARAHIHYAPLARDEQREATLSHVPDTVRYLDGAPTDASDSPTWPEGWHSAGSITESGAQREPDHQPTD